MYTDKVMEGYSLDLENIFKFVNSSESKEKSREIQEGYDNAKGRQVLSTRVISETESDLKGQESNFRYDFIKYLLDNLFDDNNAFTKELVISTFMKYNFLTEEKTNE